MDSVKMNLINDKSNELLVNGRSLNKGDKFNQGALELLTESIKLNPNLIESWVELAECYQKKSDFAGAIVCLESALKNCDKPNKLILRNLSACVRQRPVDSQEAKIAALLKSLDLSKEALKLDLNDTHSYYNLAKAYMCLFFATECVDETLIRLSRSAFEKVAVSDAEKIKSEEVMPNETFNEEHSNSEQNINEEFNSTLMEQSDFLFNYATVLIYMQDFQLAANLLHDAISAEPEWNQPKELLESLHDYITQIYLISTDLTKNAKKSSRRYKKTVEAMKNVANFENYIIQDEQRLRKCSSCLSLRETSINELVDQMNTHEEHQDLRKSDVQDSISINILHIKLLFTINYNQAMYLTFIGIDKNYSFTVVTIYNLSAQHSPSNRDVITVIEPKIESIAMKLPSLKKSISYNRINVKQFRDFYINGRRISYEQVAKPQAKVSMLADKT